MDFLFDKKNIVFIDSETSLKGELEDLGAIRGDNEKIHTHSYREFSEFVNKSKYICGHNIIHHDLKYIGRYIDNNKVFIDTLYLSPLLFPKKPYHSLVKDDKLQDEELNNPLNDSIKARDLFYDEINAFMKLPSILKRIFCALLYKEAEFVGFFDFIKFTPYVLKPFNILDEFEGKICSHVDMQILIRDYPVELAYSLALIYHEDRGSITPPWVLKKYPRISNVIKLLRHSPCAENCKYCASKFDVVKQLNKVFGFSEFRKYNGEPLQEKAAEAAVRGKSLLAVFPTGGGKSITYQLPAIISGQTENGLTVIISPLQSLMKDQVDNLTNKGIYEAVTINGMIDSIERANAIESVFNGKASMLYISPELLRSKTIEKLLLSRNISRVVIDEAHCFSAWGQDFRVDYLYIGDFLKELQIKKKLMYPIPVSCFTATAKQKVISDIKDYFKNSLGLELELFASNANRENLHYQVLFKETEDDKYNELRRLIEDKNCSTIVYVSRTKRAENIAEKLTSDGFKALAYYGDLDRDVKIKNQELFMSNEVKIMVATSAFGMGVDKSDVKLVIHYDISDSLENYIQEAGRAGRDPSLMADCYVLYNNNDLDKHFLLLNQSKVSVGDIQQIWKAIKDVTKYRTKICCSALELARVAGWNEEKSREIETRVKTAISALEIAGYIKRGQNVPRVFATSIQVKNMGSASQIIEQSELFSKEQKELSKRIIKFLISTRSLAKAGNEDAESRVDYIADRLGKDKKEIIDCIELMRRIKLLDNYNDMSADIYFTDTENKSMQILERSIKMENYIASLLKEEGVSFNLKELNDMAIKDDIKFSNIKLIRKILYFWIIKNYIVKSEYNTQNRTDIIPVTSIESFNKKREKRYDICKYIIKYLFAKKDLYKINNKVDKGEVDFSVLGLMEEYNSQPTFSMFFEPATQYDIQEALLYLSKIDALKLQGGFLVIYNSMEIERIVTDNKIKYKKEDYKSFDEFYKQKIQQIHIVGEYANLMVKDYQSAIQYVNDYFRMDFKKFIAKYFKGNRAKDIERNMTPQKYKEIFGKLSPKQLEIINDEQSKYIIVAAGPGSGKTMVLVHKLASLMMIEDVKHEQLLMLTFSRAAATEFKKRLIKLIGGAAHFLEIKTFHSYCFDLIGKIGNIEEAESVVKEAAKMIANGDVEYGKITKSVVVIDESQDMDENEFELIKALMARNEDLKIIAVGDDDQNIYEFRGSSSEYLKVLINEYGAKKYEMVENYRSCPEIVNFANQFARNITNRMKEEEGCAVNEEKGKVVLVKHNGLNIEQSIIKNILQAKNNGKICILTNTNEEAAQLVGMLIKNGLHARLIQSIDGFNLYNLVEVRYFIEQLKKQISVTKISKEVWDRAKSLLRAKYKNSTNLSNCENMINDFELTNSQLYLTDLEEFVKESNFEDFYKSQRDEIIVSTIHKSKGREFDSVYMLLNNVSANNNTDKRKLYVGITRAKKYLEIHYNNNLFSNKNYTDVDYFVDDNNYDETKEISLQLTHKDVILDYFINKERLVNNFTSGDELKMDGEYLTAKYYNQWVKVVKFSKACLDKLSELKQKGYFFNKANIRFIVYWKKQDDNKEVKIILPELQFVK